MSILVEKSIGSMQLAEFRSRTGDPLRDCLTDTSSDRGKVPRLLGVGLTALDQLVDGGHVSFYHEQSVVDRADGDVTRWEVGVDAPGTVKLRSGTSWVDVKVSDLREGLCGTVDGQDSKTRFVVGLVYEIANDILIVIDGSL